MILSVALWLLPLIAGETDHGVGCYTGVTPASTETNPVRVAPGFTPWEVSEQVGTFFCTTDEFKVGKPAVKVGRTSTAAPPRLHCRPAGATLCVPWRHCTATCVQHFGLAPMWQLLSRLCPLFTQQASPVYRWLWQRAR